MTNTKSILLVRKLDGYSIEISKAQDGTIVVSEIAGTGNKQDRYACWISSDDISDQLIKLLIKYRGFEIETSDDEKYKEKFDTAGWYDDNDTSESLISEFNHILRRYKNGKKSCMIMVHGTPPEYIKSIKGICDVYNITIGGKK